ncbi:SIMPL domain-containing protein [Pseudochryseolinea flava]|nr:SIMPL domain-containing protein [Pseudochryseolinea flava]
MRFKLMMVLMFVATAVFAQEGFKGEHFIEVTGTAEQEIDPNEITVLIRLREFEENRQKTSLEKLDQDFLAALKNAGIDKKRLELADAGSNIGKFGRKDKEAFRVKSYNLKLSSGAELEKFLEKLEPVKVDLVNIVKVTHTEIEKLKLDLKVKALQAAKAKATTLLTAIGGEIGKTLMVREWEEPVQPMYTANVMYKAESYDGDAGGVVDQQSETPFKKIKLRSQIAAQFEVK